MLSSKVLFGSWFACSLLPLSLPALAQPGEAALPPAFAVFRNAHEVSDETLARMRGRFVGANGIAHFGVEMYTEWQTGDGELLAAGLQLAAHRPATLRGQGRARLRPTVTLFHRAPGEGALPQDSAGSQAATASASGGLNGVSGVVQTIQVAGDTNLVNQDLQLSITTSDESSDYLPVAGGSTVPGVRMDSSGTATLVADTQSVITATTRNNRLGIEIQVPGKGVVRQQLGGAGLNSALQHVQLTSNLNRVRNVININAQLRPSKRALATDLGASLRAIQGL